ncbi:MAG: decarboxylating 6-phosphogluconate dehydrogenase [Gammaproteobacteria bacterium]|jgi:6-phosphogluconate dehydrogenase
MEIGIVGLGRMGGNMVRRLAGGGVRVTGWALEADVTRSLGEEAGFTPPESLAAMVAQLDAPRIVWVMVPAGAPTESTVAGLKDLLEAGDVVVDGGNSMFKDSMRRARELEEAGIGFVDAGVSGGVWGLSEGYALMVGGAAPHVARVEPYLRVLAPAPDRGWTHCGPAGSGHYVKMIHNGIEYGMMQAFAEGFALMENREEFDLDLAAIAESWRHGSVVRSWLLDLTAEFLKRDADLSDIAPFVSDSGEGRWTVIDSIEQGVPAPVITMAMAARFASQGKADYGNRMLAMMRNAFGGHAVKGAAGEGGQ